MHNRASWHLRVAYAVSLLAAVLPVGLASSGWVTMTTGGSAFLIVPYIGPLLFLLLGLYRVAVIFRRPATLDSPNVAGFAASLRFVGVAALYLGAVIGLVNLLSVPLTKALFSNRSGTGVEFYVVGVYLSFVGGVGVLGLILFELSRLRAFEMRANLAEAEAQ